MEHPWGKDILSNELPGVINGHDLRGPSFIWVYIVKTFKNPYCQKTVFIMMSGERLGLWASCLLYFYLDT